MTKRCAVCNSTERDDTLSGLGEPLSMWYWVREEWRCNRCHSAITETVTEWEDEPKHRTN